MDTKTVFYYLPALDHKGAKAPGDLQVPRPNREGQLKSPFPADMRCADVVKKMEEMYPLSFPDRHAQPKKAAADVSASPAEPALSGAALDETVEAWLADTGCGHDLVSKGDVAVLKKILKRAKVPLTFNTANGSTDATQVATFVVDELGGGGTY